MNQAALESRSIQSLIDKTSIPEAKMYVGGVRSTQDEQIVPFVVSLSNHLAGNSDRSFVVTHRRLKSFPVEYI